MSDREPGEDEQRDESSDAEPSDDEPSDAEVVRTGAEAAEDVIFSRYKQSDVTDFDVTVTFEEGILDVDVYLNAPEGIENPDDVADDAARAAQAAVDELFAGVEEA